MYFSVALRICHTPKTRLAVTVISPTREVDNRVQADAFQRNSKPERRTHFTADITQPFSASVGLSARLSNKNWPAVTFMNFQEQIAQGPILRV